MEMVIMLNYNLKSVAHNLLQIIIHKLQMQQILQFHIQFNNFFHL